MCHTTLHFPRTAAPGTATTRATYRPQSNAEGDDRRVAEVLPVSWKRSWQFPTPPFPGCATRRCTSREPLRRELPQRALPTALSRTPRMTTAGLLRIPPCRGREVGSSRHPHFRDVPHDVALPENRCAGNCHNARYLPPSVERRG